MIYNLKLSRNVQIHSYCYTSRGEKSSLYYSITTVHRVTKQNKITLFYEDTGFVMAVSELNNSKAQNIVFHSKK